MSNQDDKFCSHCGYAFWPRPAETAAPGQSSSSSSSFGPTDVPLASPSAPPTVAQPAAPNPFAPQPEAQPAPPNPFLPQSAVQATPPNPFSPTTQPPSANLFGVSSPQPQPFAPPLPPYERFSIGAETNPRLPAQQALVPPTATRASSYSAPIARPKHRNRTLIGIVALVVALLIVGGSTTFYLINAGRHGTGLSSVPSQTVTVPLTPANKVVLQNSLTAPIKGWTNNKYCRFASNGYHVVASVCLAPTNALTAFDMTVTTQQISGVISYSYGVAFRRTSSGSYYSFEINSSGNWRVLKTVDKHTTTLVPYASTPAIHRGLNNPNVLEVSGVGSTFDFYVNGTHVGQATDSSITSGICGFEVDHNIDVAFTNVNITALGS